MWDDERPWQRCYSYSIPSDRPERIFISDGKSNSRSSKAAAGEDKEATTCDSDVCDGDVCEHGGRSECVRQRTERRRIRERRCVGQPRS